MSFERPLLLLSLLVVGLAVVAWFLAERRRARYAVRYTNIDVLATVVERREWRRYVPPVLFALALAALLLSLGRPHVNRMVASEKATVILVLDTSRSMQATDVKPTRLGAAQEAMKMFLDQRAGSAPRRARRLRRRGAGRDAADLRSRPRRAVRRLGRRVPHLRRDGDRGRTAGRDRARQAVRRPASEVGGADRRAGPGHEIARLVVARAGRRRAVAGPGLRREEPRLDPLPLGRRPDAWPPRAAPGRASSRGTPAIPCTPSPSERRRGRSGAGSAGSARAARTSSSPCRPTPRR